MIGPDCQGDGNLFAVSVKGLHLNNVAPVRVVDVVDPERNIPDLILNIRRIGGEIEGQRSGVAGRRYPVALQKTGAGGVDRLAAAVDAGDVLVGHAVLETLEAPQLRYGKRHIDRAGVLTDAAADIVAIVDKRAVAVRVGELAPVEGLTRQNGGLIAAVADNRVRAGAARDRIVTGVAGDIVSARAAVHGIIARARIDAVIARARNDRVAAAKILGREVVLIDVLVARRQRGVIHLIRRRVEVLRRDRNRPRRHARRHNEEIFARALNLEMEAGEGLTADGERKGRLKIEGHAVKEDRSVQTRAEKLIRVAGLLIRRVAADRRITIIVRDVEFDRVRRRDVEACPVQPIRIYAQLAEKVAGK